MVDGEDHEDEAVVPAETFSGCLEAVPRCGEAAPLPRNPAPDTCHVHLYDAARESITFTVRPAARAGAPYEARATYWREREEVGHRHISASRWVFVGGARLVAPPTHHRHEHGGAPAHVGGFTIHAFVAGDHPLPFAVPSATFSALGDPRDVGPLHIGAVELPPGASEVSVGYAAREAYMTSRERFRTHARVRVGDADAVLAVEHRVIRFEPLHRR